MAKELVKKIKLQIDAGKATAAPPVGTVLGPVGINLGEFCSKFNDETKDKLNAIVDELERIVRDEDNAEIKQDLSDIRTELQTPNPTPKILRKSFKALVWGASVTCKAAIEKLVGDAIDILSQML